MAELPEVSPLVAWQQSIALARQVPEAAEYLFRCNLGLEDTRVRFDNPYLTADRLGITPDRARVLADERRQSKSWWRRIWK
jgi:hypothetical protein